MLQSKSAVLSLMGEQPSPVLIPLLFIRPTTAVFVATEQTRRRAERIGNLVRNRMDTDLVIVPAYDVRKAQSLMEEWLEGNRLAFDEVWINFSGGTKPMALAAFAAAARFGPKLLYLESERRRSILYKYTVDNDGRLAPVQREEVPPIIDIKTYIRAHVDDARFDVYKNTAGRPFEESVANALRRGNGIDEVIEGVRFSGGQVDIDVVVRCGNQIGLVEAKTGQVKKEAIDQLNTAAQQLGTYVAKFWVRANTAQKSPALLDELARAQGIVVIELRSYDQATHTISPNDAQKLVSEVRRALTGES
jgi:Holliday junction resolvase-like predicted endonuclease